MVAAAMGEVRHRGAGSRSRRRRPDSPQGTHHLNLRSSMWPEVLGSWRRWSSRAHPRRWIVSRCQQRAAGARGGSASHSDREPRRMRGSTTSRRCMRRSPPLVGRAMLGVGRAMPGATASGAAGKAKVAMEGGTLVLEGALVLGGGATASGLVLEVWGPGAPQLRASPRQSLP